MFKILKVFACKGIKFSFSRQYSKVRATISGEMQNEVEEILTAFRIALQSHGVEENEYRFEVSDNIIELETI